MRKWRRLSYSLTFLFATSLFLVALRNLKAQALPAAARTGELSAFATYSRVTTDYGYPNKGGTTFGLLYVREVRWFLTPSIEFRVKATFDGRTVDEHTWGGGIRFERRIRDFRPYGNFFISSGTIHYNFSNPYNPHPTATPYTWDNSIVYSPGFGVDYNLSRYWGARFDYQFEFWNLGNSQTLTPQAMSFGILYRIQFGRETGP
jgi:hypothetical protein